MIRHALLQIQERYHPLFRLRKLAAFRWLMSGLHFPVAIRIDGIAHPVCVDFSRNLSWVLSDGKVAEPEERANFSRLTQSSGCKSMFDIGANVGLYAFTFSSGGADRRVVMFEPDALNAKLLRTTVARFHLRNCELIEAAVSDREGVLTFHTDSVSGATGSIEGGESFLQRHNQGAPGVTQVRSVTLDSVSGSAESDPDVIKIDAEGAELGIFRGAEAILSRSHPMLFFESSKDGAEIGAHLARLGYLLFDPMTFQRVDVPGFNCMALHAERHKGLMGSH